MDLKLAGDFQKVHCPGDVHTLVQGRLFNRRPHAGTCGQVNHDFRLDALRNFSQRIHIPHVRLEKLVASGVLNLLKVEALAAGSVEIIEAVHDGQLRPAANQFLRYVGSNEARATCK